MALSIASLIRSCRGHPPEPIPRYRIQPSYRLNKYKSTPIYFHHPSSSSLPLNRLCTTPTSRVVVATTMDALISTLSVTHVSQAAYDLESFKASLAPLVTPPSPSQSSSNGYESPRTRPSSTIYQYQYEDDAELAAAFAGDAFAPMWKKQEDPWRGFKQQNAFTVNVQTGQVQQQS